jgi:hypothetical protein
MPPSDDQPRALTTADVEAVVDCFIDRISDRRTVEQVTTAWSGVIDRAIGRGVRKLVFAVVLTVVLIGAVKFGFVEKAITAAIPLKGTP